MGRTEREGNGCVQEAELTAWLCRMWRERVKAGVLLFLSWESEDLRTREAEK